jgi:hypothetical protein
VGDDRTPHQRRVIRDFYRHRGALEAQRLQELVGEIYLAGTDAQRTRLWERAGEILARTKGLEASEVERVLSERDVEGLAALAARGA